MEVKVIKARNGLIDRTNGKILERIRVAAYCRVSTDSEEQLNSQRSQIAYYTDLIKKNRDWILVDIYADEAISGTQVKKRKDFQKMINDCMNGEIDMIITKSISRFTRSLVDLLKYVRMLKEKNIAIYFQEENINTLTKDGELLLMILDSIVEQQVKTTSNSVKKGLQMKMQRGELVGFQGCLGYDYNLMDKSLSVNYKEAEIVKYIFQRYANGAGATVITHELNNLGYKTKRGNNWTPSSVIGIIKNEKYKGDILLGKTFTLDHISKRRFENLGEEDQFYIKNHHEPIISEEMFEKANEILKRRGKNRSRMSAESEKREKFSRQYAFSCMLECGFCGSNLSRRSWHSNSKNQKTVWQCVTGTKKGKKYCPDSKGISESVIEEAFIESYHLLCSNNKDVLEEFIQRVEKTLSESNVEKSISKIDKEISSLDEKKKKLLDMRLEDSIDKVTYEEKNEELRNKQKQLLDERIFYQEQLNDEKNLKRRTTEFKKELEKNQVLEEFDRAIFESIIEKVIVGEIDEEGNKNPYKLTFVYKTGISNKVKVNAKGKRDTTIGKAVKDSIQKMYSYVGNGVKNVYSQMRTDTCGVCLFNDEKCEVKVPKKPIKWAFLESWHRA